MEEMFLFNSYYGVVWIKIQKKRVLQLIGLYLFVARIFLCLRLFLSPFFFSISTYLLKKLGHLCSRDPHSLGFADWFAMV